MATHWTGTIATQTVAFRGTSQVQARATATTLPSSPVLDKAIYSLNVAGGISGSFGVHVIGWVAGASYILAGITACNAAGRYILYPVGYSSSGLGTLVGATTIPPVGALGDIFTLDQTVPPSYVIFQSGVATAGISANCTVGALLKFNA